MDYVKNALMDRRIGVEKAREYVRVIEECRGLDESEAALKSFLTLS